MLNKTPCFSPSVELASELLGANLKADSEKAKKRPYTVTDRKTRGNHLKKHQWKKGQSGNPKGRPIKNLSLVSLVKERLEAHPEEAKAIALALIAMAKSKDMRAIEELLNRIDGKVAEKHQMEGVMSIKLLFIPAQQFLNAPETHQNQYLEALENKKVELLTNGEK